MTSSASGCPAVVLNQQNQQVIQHCHPCDGEHPPAPCASAQVKNCTVVENGRVVVKPLPA